MDRSTRNYLDWVAISDLSDSGYEVRFAVDDIDLQTRSGRVAAEIQLVLGVDYVRNLREESIKGQRGRLEQGLYPYAAPIGYLDTGKGSPKAIDPIKAPLVRELFRLYATGEYSYDQVTHIINKQGLANRRGKPMSKSSVEKIIRNPFYTGRIRILRTGETFQGKHAPLISEKHYAQTEDVRMGRRRKTSIRHDYRFRGVFTCDECNRAMVGERQKGRVYYRCHRKGCRGTGIREDQIDTHVIEHLGIFQLSPSDISKLRKSLGVWIRKKLRGKLASDTSLQISSLDERMSRLTDKLIDELVDDETFKLKKSELVRERNRLQQLSQKYRPIGWYDTKVEELLELMKSLSFQYQNADDLQKRLILRFAGSNFCVGAKEAVIATPKWWSTLENIGSVSLCAPEASPTRTFEDFVEALEQFEMASIEVRYLKDETRSFEEVLRQ